MDKTSETVEEILIERGVNYGDFFTGSEISQRLKASLRNSDEWQFMEPDMREALDMIMAKASRIVNGHSDHLDSWVDIIGYAQLVIDNLAQNKRNSK